MSWVTKPSLSEERGRVSPEVFQTQSPLWMPQQDAHSTRRRRGPSTARRDHVLTRQIPQRRPPHQGWVLFSGDKLKACLCNCQSQDADSIFHFSRPFYPIPYCQSDLVPHQFFSRSTHQRDNQPDKHQILASLLCTCYCSKPAQNDAHQQECFESWRYPGA